jgi:hypothetical protein
MRKILISPGVKLRRARMTRDLSRTGGIVAAEYYHLHAEENAGHRLEMGQ